MYTTIISALEGVVQSSVWLNYFADIAVYPSDFNADIRSDNYFRYSVITSNSMRLDYYGRKEARGEVIVSIFTKREKGPQYVTSLCDKLDIVLSNKSFAENKLQTTTSYLLRLGTDPADDTLTRTDYHLPFTYFGE